mmetsp:Transcript_43765/g.133189  ORF Transcript_43765/g.133189 Transcript_43765/m.133189 type:complete len:203 (+) Transcript_43765:791-1399(+)
MVAHSRLKTEHGPDPPHGVPEGRDDISAVQPTKTVHLEQGGAVLHDGRRVDLFPALVGPLVRPLRALHVPIPSALRERRERQGLSVAVPRPTYCAAYDAVNGRPPRLHVVQVGELFGSVAVRALDVGQVQRGTGAEAHLHLLQGEEALVLGLIVHPFELLLHIDRFGGALHLFDLPLDARILVGVKALRCLLALLHGILFPV